MLFATPSSIQYFESGIPNISKNVISYYGTQIFTSLDFRDGCASNTHVKIGRHILIILSTYLVIFFRETFDQNSLYVHNYLLYVL